MDGGRRHRRGDRRLRDRGIAAAAAGLDGVEVNAGQYSLIRQFLSGLTNQRGDEWGTDRSQFAREVLGAVRRGLGPDRVLGLRLSCDELAPWAGIVPEAGAAMAAELAPLVDYLVVVRGSIFSAAATRPDGHVEPGSTSSCAGRCGMRSTARRRSVCRDRSSTSTGPRPRSTTACATWSR